MLAGRRSSSRARSKLARPLPWWTTRASLVGQVDHRRERQLPLVAATAVLVVEPVEERLVEHVGEQQQDRLGQGQALEQLVLDVIHDGGNSA
jgi:hypothetical protein